MGELTIEEYGKSSTRMIVNETKSILTFLSHTDRIDVALLIIF